MTAIEPPASAQPQLLTLVGEIDMANAEDCLALAKAVIVVNG